jgi:thiol-disulfide isomerase/thioredoxin
MYWTQFALVVLAVALCAPVPLPADDKVDPFADLIGKPAPEIAVGDFAVNGKPVKLADLKGKVVLLNFWAVWCVECVRTFPHLREWHTQYHSQGLEIVGLTSYYGRTKGIDKANGQVQRIKPGEEKVTPEAERAVLKDFAEYHKLAHLLTAVPPNQLKATYDAYKVKVIPDFVLIDRKGNVRMVKFGNKPENAQALGQTIKTLVAE